MLREQGLSNYSCCSKGPHPHYIVWEGNTLTSNLQNSLNRKYAKLTSDAYIITYEFIYKRKTLKDMILYVNFKVKWIPNLSAVFCVCDFERVTWILLVQLFQPKNYWFLMQIMIWGENGTERKRKPSISQSIITVVTWVHLNSPKRSLDHLLQVHKDVSL